METLESIIGENFEKSLKAFGRNFEHMRRSPMYSSRLNSNVKPVSLAKYSMHSMFILIFRYVVYFVICYY